MADVARTIGTAEQVRLVAALRWRIFRNGWGRSHGLEVVGAILVTVVLTTLVIAVGVAFGAGAHWLLSTGRYGWMAALFWAVCLFWQVFPIFVASFGATFDFRSLLRFPLSLSTFYVVGLAYGLADAVAVASVCWLLAMTIGAAAARPDLLPAMVVIDVLLVWFNVTLERLGASWLERLLARRRTREVLLGLLGLLGISAQLVAKSADAWRRSAGPWLEPAWPYVQLLPPGLAGRAIVGAADGHPARAAWAGAGIAVYAGVLSVLLWKRVAAQWRGEDLSETMAPARIRTRSLARASTGRGETEWLPPRVAAVFRKEVRYLMRNPPALLSLLMPPLFLVLITAGSRSTSPGSGGPHDFYFLGMMGYLLLLVMSPSYNSFAYEGGGMLTYFTAPVRLHEVLVGKNLLAVVTIAIEIVVSIAMLATRVGLPAPPVLASALAGMCVAIVGQLPVANWSSVTYPQKLDFAARRRRGHLGMAVLLPVLVNLVIGGVCFLILLAGPWTGNVWLPLQVFGALAVPATWAYVASLKPLSALALEKRDALLEAVC